MGKKAVSPTSTGPAGAQFEAKVGAYYLLAMMLDSEPRGLRGARIERVQLQGAGDGHPLDDVIVHARSLTGSAATLEIQAKRKITFSPTDAVFHAVLEQIADVVKAGGVDSSELSVLAIATAQGSRQIDGAYQEVLVAARNAGDAGGFFARLARPNAANENMRTFVKTVREKLTEFGAASDDATIWKLLRKLQILIFDFSAEQGQSEALARELCRQALDVDELAKAGALWSALTDLAQALASSGGEIDAAGLRQRLVGEYGFKLAGLRQNRAAVAALSEASHNALQDVRNRVADVVLSRRGRLDMVNVSLDRGRYVQILGDAGVGKSGVLRALAEQAAISGNTIVLNPTRTPARGWTSMRREIGFPGTAADLLNDIASSGEATLFVDSVDFFEDVQRATVNDLIRAAAAIPGFRVVVTARRSFGAEEANWLDPDALDTLGRAPVVVIDELNDDEIAELRNAAPQLAALLADGHPAREVIRNLFRLDRLIRQGQGAHIPQTEAEMARLWWTTGDGAKDSQSRDRTRILRGLAEQSLPGYVGPLDTSGFLAPPLDELIASGTLKEFRGERMVFRHDVFRDWAVANLLREEPSALARLPLSRPAPASLFRGVDLAARLAIENSSDADAWKEMLATLATPDVHGSWKRAVIVALVRSELSLDALARAEGLLLADHGELLRELIRTVMALDVMPLSQLLSGLTLPEGVSDLQMPVGPSWRRLIVWIQSLKDRLPVALIPDVAKLYIQYLSMAWGFDKIANALLIQIHAWLLAVEGKIVPSDGPKLTGGGYGDHHELHQYLRSGFLAFSATEPKLAESYLNHLLSDLRAARYSAESVVMAPGGLAKAAPEKLAELTARTLIESPKSRRIGLSGREDHEAFSFSDNKFLSPSPARGPFLELLNQAPKTGLALIRRLVMHACTFRGRGRASKNDDAVVIDMPSGIRRFPYPGSYFWSRDGNGYYCTTSALMALEAWAHQRIDSGAPAADVIADILGDGEPPAAYLLVVVDVILSHWTKAWKDAIPFVGNPQLLAWDRTRQTRDRMGDFGLFGEPEPRGGATRESLKKRESRTLFLENALPIYAFRVPPEDLAELRKRLETAAASLGPYEAHSDFGDPRFMVRHALNVIDRANYQDQEVTNEAGAKTTASVYVAPPDEARHLVALGSKRSPQMNDASLRAELTLAVGDPARANVDLVAKSVPWARDITDRGEVQQDFDHSLLIAAYLLMRNGDAGQRAEHGDWASKQFAAALAREEDPVHRMRDGLNFNPVGLGTAGLVLSIYHSAGLAGARPILELAARGDPAAAHGFQAVLDKLSAIDSRLPRSVMRCAFQGSIRAHLKRYDAENAAEDAARSRHIAQQRDAAVIAEWNWLEGKDVEPAWPNFPDPELNIREPMYIGDPSKRRQRTPRPEAKYYADHQAAAVWLVKFLADNLVVPDWLRSVATAYGHWTSLLNGAGLDSEQELAREPNGWNAAYFRLVARALTGLDAAVIDGLCITPVVSLPDEPFLDVASELQWSLDEVYFRNGGLSEENALRLRTRLIQRLQQTSQWRNFARRPGYGIPFHLDGALGTALMSSQGFRQPPTCYVTTLGMPRAGIFIPALTELAEATPSLFAAKAALSIVSVSPDYPFVVFGVRAISACMRQFPNDTKIWIDHGVGADFCAWLRRAINRDGLAVLEKAGVRAIAENLLSALIRLGVPEATTLERELVATIVG